MRLPSSPELVNAAARCSHSTARTADGTARISAHAAKPTDLSSPTSHPEPANGQDSGHGEGDRDPHAPADAQGAHDSRRGEGQRERLRRDARPRRSA